MAFYGSLGEVNFDNLDASIVDTATDIFVYDTRKDSDGGAWRNRTQHTSWYNETLNTATRGSRREFPAVAVIVAEADQVTIYDGDDPDLPMWMVFYSQSFGLFNNNNPVHTILSVSALNGVLCGGGNKYSCVGIVNFVADTAFKQSANSGTYAGLYFRGMYLGNIAQRNSSLGFDGNLHGYSDWVVSDPGNDVAMTVLPNAPIDDATGLPIPTIAVATDGGVSVIKDDGTVNSVSHAYGESMKIDVDGDVLLATHNGPTSGQSAETFNLITLTQLGDGGSGPAHGDNAIGTDETYYGYGSIISGANYMPFVTPNFGITVNPIVRGNDIFFGDDLLIHIEEDRTFPANGMSNYITSDYNTGWMHGDCKGAFLSDTDATNVTAGSNYVTNGTFDTDSDWIKYNNTTVWTISGGTASMSATASYLPLYQYNLGLTAGKRYVASVDVTAITGQLKFDTSNSTGGGIDGNDGVIISTTGTHTFIFTADSTQDGIGIAREPTYTSSCTIDNITIYELQEQDRSVNNKGLQVFGTVTKSAVATGAELVGYSNFSSSRYLQQPYNSDFNFGTGDYSIILWINSPSLAGDASIFLLGDYNQTNSLSLLVWNSGGSGDSMQYTERGTSISLVIEGHESKGWTQIAIVRRGTTVYAYRNGILSQSVSNSSPNNIDFSSATYKNLTIGAGLHGGNINYAYTGSISLFRISASAPSPEQIKKIYEDEKVLFQENAACTLYGSSDAVTALAYDEVNDLLHVGTSSGRSDFNGLRRINNTTTAVTTAISAYDGLIAAQ